MYFDKRDRDIKFAIMAILNILCIFCLYLTQMFKFGEFGKHASFSNLSALECFLIATLVLLNLSSTLFYHKDYHNPLRPWKWVVWLFIAFPIFVSFYSSI